MAETVRSTRIGALARITLARPPLNVLTTAMLGELSQALREIHGGTAPERCVLRNPFE